MKSNSLFHASVLLLISLFLTLVLSVLGWCCHIPITPMIYPISFILGALFVFKFFALDQNLKVILVSLLVVFISTLLSWYLFDSSWDGKYYHQAIISALKNGWNPIYSYQNDAIALPLSTSVLVNSYTRNIEIIQACFYAMTGWLEASKAVNFILTFISVGFVYQAISVQFSDVMNKTKRFFYALLISISPVTLCQLLTFYIDYAMIAFVLIILSIALINSEKKRYYFLIGTVVSMAIGTKINTFFFVGILAIVIMGYYVYTKEWNKIKKMIFTLCLSSLMGVFFIGFNPFVTNTIAYQHPFYPLMVSNPDQGALDIMTPNTPKILQNNSRIEILPSYCMTMTDDISVDRFHVGLPKGLMMSAGQRIGGFGPFFPILLLLCLIVYLTSKSDKRNYRIGFAISVISLFVSVHIFREGWWARYVPFFWMAPIVMLIYWEISCSKKRWQKGLVYLCWIIAVGNLAIAARASYLLSKNEVIHQYHFINQVKSLEEKVYYFEGAVSSVADKLDYEKIQYQKVTQKDSTWVVFSNLGYPSEVIESPAIYTTDLSPQ